MAKPRYLPYGYRIQNGLITPDTAQAEYVRQIYQLYLAGNSLQEIAKHLQANSIPYSDETGWNKNTVHRIVKNPAYCGKDRYPPIVEYTLFQKAQVLCQRKAPTYTEALKDIRGDIICPDCDSRLEWQTKGHRWRCRHCAAFSVQIAPDILLQSIATTMKRLQDNPDSINDQPLSHNTVSIEAEKQQAEIDEMLSAGEFDAASLIQSVLSRADTQYLCCTAGNSDPMTLRIKEALAAAPPCDTFDSKLYHTIADKNAYQTICNNAHIDSINNIDRSISNQLVAPFHATAAGIGSTYFEKRIYELVTKICARIIDSAGRRIPYICGHAEYMQLCEEICRNISPSQYTPDYESFRQAFVQSDLTEEMLQSRECRQLRYCNLTTTEISDHLSYEQYYENIRQHYLRDAQKEKILSTERIANQNHKDVVLELQADGRDKPSLRLVKTKRAGISTMPNEFSRWGAYIFLTKDKLPNQISWKDENGESDE